MKALIIALAILTSYLPSDARHLNQDTTYYQSADLHKFDGTWEYTDSNITFKIILKTEKTLLKGSTNYLDLITGYHIYIKNQKVIQSSIGKLKTIKNGFYLDKDVSKSKIKFLFTDLGRETPIHGILELLPSGEIRWTVKNLEGIRLNVPGINEHDHTIYVPTDLILKKVN
jgi:hypothetical protein